MPLLSVNSEKDTSLKRFPAFTLSTIQSGVTTYRSFFVCLGVRSGWIAHKSLYFAKDTFSATKCVSFTLKDTGSNRPP